MTLVLRYIHISRVARVYYFCNSCAGICKSCAKYINFAIRVPSNSLFCNYCTRNCQEHIFSDTSYTGMHLYLVEMGVIVTQVLFRNSKRNYKRKVNYYVLATSIEDAKQKAKLYLSSVEDNPPLAFGAKQNTRHSKIKAVRRDYSEPVVSGPLEYAADMHTGVTYTMPVI